MPNIIETAENAGQFKTLIRAVKAAGLEQTLEGKGPFTVFAPTDEAFEHLPPGQLDKLLKDKDRLKQVLNYHVCGERCSSNELKSRQKVKTLQGSSLRIEPSGSKLRINKAEVLQPDVRASNGVIHTIDNVLMPS